jgi:predicted  nucleic acid-binding Zn-ribbon protein
MAKCRRCGDNGLFLKVNQAGFCAKCEKIAKHEGEIDRLKREAAEASSRAADAVKLLAQAEEAAKTQALRNLEVLERRLSSEIAQKTEMLTDLSAAVAGASAELEAVEKKARTAENRVSKVTALFKSMSYAIDHFMSPESEYRDLKPVFDACDFSSIAPVQLNCMTMKALRARYRQNEQRVREVFVSYEKRYTTKANAAIYKLMVLALEAELQNILHTINYGKLETAQEAVKALIERYYAIATDGNQNIAPTLRRFIGQIEELYLEAVAIEYEYYVQRERAREEQRAIKEQMRQEAEERKKLEQERKQIENEEKKYRTEMERIAAQLAQTPPEDESAAQVLNARLQEIQEQLDSVEGKKAEIINLQNGKAGTVYIISNIGSFGDHVFKIGMTRRLEPQERINELGDASVPFPFDVHSFIFSNDAVSLECALHKEMNERRVNKVNLRKEFFNVSVAELQALVERLDPTAPFQMTALAEQYYQSLSITDVPDECAVVIDEEDEAS